MNVNTKNKNFLKFFQDDSELNEIHEQLWRICRKEWNAKVDRERAKRLPVENTKRMKNFHYGDICERESGNLGEI